MMQFNILQYHNRAQLQFVYKPDYTKTTIMIRITTNLTYKSMHIFCLQLNYPYKKFINIRKTQTEPTISKQSIAKLKPNFTNFKVNQQQNNLQINNKKNDNQIPIQNIPTVQQNSSSNPKMSKESHQIYYALKNATKLSQLFHMVKKYGYRMNIQEALSLFDKIVYFNNIQIRDPLRLKNKNDQITKQINDKYDDIIQLVQRLMFKSAYRPENYIKYIYALSKTQSQYLFDQSFKTLMKILNKQLATSNITLINSLSNNEAKSNKIEIQPSQSISTKQSIPDQHISKSQIATPTVNQVISIENNVKFLQSLLRICNHKMSSPKYSQQDYKVILAFLQDSIKYIHLPSTHDKIQNRLFWQLIKQYMNLYPKLKLRNTVIKSLIRDLLARIKHEALLKRAKFQNITKQNPVTEKQIVSTLNRLFMLEQFFLQQTRKNALIKQILQTKQKNLPYNAFYAIQHKIHKNIIQFLPKCVFEKKSKVLQQQQQSYIKQDQGIIWQHVELASKLQKHLQKIWMQFGTDVIGKCSLLTSIYEQYESVCKYLINLFSFLIKIQSQSSNITFTHNQKPMLFNILSSSYNILYLFMNKNFQQKIPTPIVTKSMNQYVLNFITKNFSLLPIQLQVITIWYTLQNEGEGVNKYKQNFIKQLIKTMLRYGESLDKSSEDRNSHLLIQRNFGSAKCAAYWYIKLLIDNQKYQKIIKQNNLQLSESQLAYNCIKKFIKQISLYSKDTKEKKEIIQHCIQVGKKIGTYLKQTKEGQKIFQKLIKNYQRQSINNCLFKSSQIQILQSNKNYFNPKKCAQSINFRQQIQTTTKQAIRLKQNITDRINSCLQRALTLLHLVIAFNHKPQITNKPKQISQILRIYKQQFMLLNYEEIINHDHKQILKKIGEFTSQQQAKEYEVFQKQDQKQS